MTLRTNYVDGGAPATPGDITAADMNAIAAELNTATAAIGPFSALAPYRVGDIVNRSTPRATPELWTVFAGKANGSAPTTFDSGQPATVTLGPTGSAAPQISNGVLTSTPSGTGNAAYYLSGTLAGTVTRIGGRFVFSGGSTNTGSALLGITNEQIVSSGGNVTVPDMSCHFAITPTAWTFGVWAGPNHGNSGLVTLASGGFATSLNIDGVSEYEAQVWIVGNTATFDLPDGTRQTVTDSRIGDATYSGSHVFFEQYANVANTDNIVGFTHVWASSGTAKPSTNTFAGWRKAIALTATTSTAIAAAAEVQVPGLALNFSAPPSGSVVIRPGVFLDLPTASSVLLAPVVSTTSGSLFPVARIGTALVGNQYIQSDFIVTGLTPGLEYTVTVYVYSSAAATIDINPGAGQNGNLVVEPLF